MRILLTGASGFVGRGIVTRAAAMELSAIRVALREGTRPPPGCDAFFIGDLSQPVDWSSAVGDRDCVIHAAARVHIMQETASDPLREFRRVNVDGTLQLARQAAHAGVKRFIFISSIKVNGEATLPGRPFTSHDVPAPAGDYGISKLEAERGLFDLAAETGMEVVVIRPVLVYGPGVKGNFQSMMSWLHRGIPLPLGRIENRRSMVSVENLADLVLRCVEHVAAANRVFLVSDGEDLSTTELLRRTAAAMNRSPRLLPVPPKILRTAAHLIGRDDIAQRLCDSLQVDIALTRVTLHWSPIRSVDDALAATVAARGSARHQ
jgi:nucleoside-diphosphate-sugar epimerase